MAPVPTTAAATSAASATKWQGTDRASVDVITAALAPNRRGCSVTSPADPSRTRAPQEEMAKRTDVDRMEALRTELMSRPGSTWADYSARRLITRQCQESKPEAERFEFLPEGDAKRWGAAILKQIPCVRSRNIPVSSCPRPPQRNQRFVVIPTQPPDNLVP